MGKGRREKRRREGEREEREERERCILNADKAGKGKKSCKTAKMHGKR
jgi:hypothetical protein